MTPIDFQPATRPMSELIQRIADDQLDAPTPCAEYTLGDLLDHVGGFAIVFAGAAKKETGELAAQPPPGDASHLGSDWRSRMPRDLDALAQVWREPSAWTGMTEAADVDLPGEVAGRIALDELVIHGWDVARSSDQEYDVDPDLLQSVYEFVSQFAEPGQEASREGLFGPIVDVPADAPLLDRVLGITGRDPAWPPTVGAPRST